MTGQITIAKVFPNFLLLKLMGHCRDAYSERSDGPICCCTGCKSFGVSPFGYPKSQFMSSLRGFTQSLLVF